MVPNTSREQTTLSPLLSQAHPIPEIAAMPDANATASSAASMAAKRFSNASTVGLVNREYTLPGIAPLNLPAASAADLKTYADVSAISSQSESLMSVNWPTRTASVRLP